jgi:hypothetical protein
MSSKLPSGFKNREEYNRYMRNYRKNYVSKQKRRLQWLENRVGYLEMLLESQK